MKLALLTAWVLASISCKSPLDKMRDSNVILTRLDVDGLAHNSYALWREFNPDKQCPTIEELIKLSPMGYTGQPRDNADTWGTPFRVVCSPTVETESAHKLTVISAGLDQKHETADDIRSCSDAVRARECRRRTPLVSPPPVPQ